MMLGLRQEHRGQMIVSRQSRRFNWLAAGRRWRKTTLLINHALRNACKRQYRVIWSAPTYDQVRIAWEEAKRAAGGLASYVVSRMEMHFPGGGRILFRSLDDPEHLRGHTAHLVFVDEVADVHPDAW